MIKPNEGYRVHASIAESKGISLAIAPLNRNVPTHALHNSLTGVQKIMKVTPAPLRLTPSTNNSMHSQKMIRKS